MIITYRLHLATAAAAAAIHGATAYVYFKMFSLEHLSYLLHICRYCWPS